MIDVTRGLLGIYNDIDGLESGPNVVIAVPSKMDREGNE